MNEVALQWNYFSRIVLLAFVALFYGLGGINGKWKRRFIASFIMVVLCSVYALLAQKFSFWILAYYPPLMGALTLRYGADVFREKVELRAICGLAIGCSAFPIAYVTGQWSIYVFHIFICTVFNVFFGSTNPIPARGEETILGFIIGFLPLFMV